MVTLLLLRVREHLNLTLDDDVNLRGHLTMLEQDSRWIELSDHELP